MVNGEYTKEDFLHGEPEELILASRDPKIMIVWPHGDERLAPLLGYHIASERPELLANVDYICANPLAAQDARRETLGGTDLNRSFNPSDKLESYEGRRARYVLDLITRNAYDYVLDVHTSYTDVDRFLLANRRNAAVDAMIGASVIDRIVMMPDHIAKAALIGQVQNSISIEYSTNVSDEQAVDECMILIDGLVKAIPLHSSAPKPRQFFTVTHPISKAEDPGDEARNFEVCAAGYYPVLLSASSMEGTYRTDPQKDYVGFAADLTSSEMLPRQ